MTEFEIERLDHVAILVSDLEASATWYEKVLGLKRYQLPEWGDYPIFMLAGKAGVALFPADKELSVSKTHAKHLRIDHFAFNLTLPNFEKAKIKYKELGIKYNFQDHHYFHSIYIKDLDGHTVELTTLVVDDKFFYR